MSGHYPLKGVEIRRKSMLQAGQSIVYHRHVESTHKSAKRHDYDDNPFIGEPARWVTCRKLHQKTSLQRSMSIEYSRWELVSRQELTKGQMGLASFSQKPERMALALPVGLSGRERGTSGSITSSLGPSPSVCDHCVLY